MRTHACASASCKQCHNDDKNQPKCQKRKECVANDTLKGNLADMTSLSVVPGDMFDQTRITAFSLQLSSAERNNQMEP